MLGIKTNKAVAINIAKDPEMKVKAVLKEISKFLLLKSAELEGTTDKCATWMAANPAL